MNKKKIIYIVSSVIFLALASGIAVWIVKKESAGKKTGVQTQGTSGDHGMGGNVLPEEDNFKVENKDDANKALEDLDGLVKSAGETSL